MGIAIAALILLVLLPLLLVIVLVALLCKLTYKIKVCKADKDADWDYDIRIRWLFGILRYKIKSGEEAEQPQVKQSKNKQKKQKKQEAEASVGAAPGRPRKNKEEKGNPLQRLKELGIDGIFRIVGYTLDLLKKIFKAFKPKRVVLRGRYGAQTPDVTGKVLAAVYAAAAALSIAADVEGNFEQEEIKLDLRAMGYFRLWVIFIPAVRYILRPEIWRLIFPKKAKKKAKKVKKAKKNNLEVDENGHRI